MNNFSKMTTSNGFFCEIGNFPEPPHVVQKLSKMFEEKAVKIKGIVESDIRKVDDYYLDYYLLFHEKWDDYLNSLGCVEEIEEPFVTIYNPGSGGSCLRVPLKLAETALALGGLPGFGDKI